MLCAVIPGDRLAKGRGTPEVEVASLASQLASGMGGILPEGFTCVANETSVILVRGHLGIRSLDLATALEWRPESWLDDLRLAVWQVLSDFQDEIVEQLHRAWPEAPSGGIGLPRVRIEGPTIQVSYSVGGETVVALDVLHLAPSSA